MSEEENTIVPGEITPGEVPAPTRRRAPQKSAKKAAKKAAKKRASRKTSADEAAAEQPEVSAQAASEKPSETFVYSTDSDDEPYADAEPAPRSETTQPAMVSEEAAPAKQDPASNKQGGNKPKHPNQKQGGRNNRNNKFNKNNRNKKGKGRWQNKKRPQEEETPIEFGELLEYEALETVESIEALAAELTEGGEPLDFNRIYELPLPELREEVSALALEVPHAPNRDQLINAVVANARTRKRPIITTGVLELLDDDEGGLLVYQRDSYRIKAMSAYVSQALIEHYGLLRGHIVKAQLHPHRENESCPFVVKVEKVMDQDPGTLSQIVPFTERVPYYPLDRILMEADSESKWDNLSMRVVDCLTPIGFGQRGLIVAPPRTGKTVLMQGMANSIQRNYPDAHLIILLIDERPEEVTDFRRQVSGEVISSTFDESAESHVHAAEMVIEKARRMVEVGKDVVILLDSITRLARAYNTTMPSSGKILSGGVEANALQKPKRFFGSARNIEDGGSLTIIATALVETGSKMDEVIFEEFKGTGNMELHLDRGLSDKRIFPALSMDKSGTRKEELLYHPDEMLKIYSLRRAMKGLPSTDAMEMLIQRIKKTNTNAEFLMSVSR